MIGSGVKLTVFLWKVESSEILLVEAFGRITTLSVAKFLPRYVNQKQCPIWILFNVRKDYMPVPYKMQPS